MDILGLNLVVLSQILQLKLLNKSSCTNQKNIDFVLAVGGGSVIDGCKYLVASALYEGDGWDF